MINADDARALMKSSAIQLAQYCELMENLESVIKQYCQQGIRTFMYCMGKETSVFKHNIAMQLAFDGYDVEDVSLTDQNYWAKLKISW